MQIELGAGEVISILIAIVGLAWTLLKVTISQFEKRLDTKFSALDNLLLDVKKLEIEQLRRDNYYSEKYVTKAEMDSCQVKHDKIVERIFTLLQSMNDKLDSKVNKTDCDNRWASQTRSKDRGEL